MVRITAEFRAQSWILGSHADRTGVQVTDAHHDAAETHQRRRSKAKFLCSQQGRNHHIATGLELAVGFQNDAAAEIIEDQSLVRFSESEFPRHARMLDAG